MAEEFSNVQHISYLEDEELRRKSLSNLRSLLKKNPPHFSSEQKDVLIERARIHLEQGDFYCSDHIIHIVAYSTERKKIPHIEMTEVYSYEGEPPTLETLRYGNDFLAHIYQQWGILEQSEQVFIHDHGEMSFGSPNLRRKEHIIVTDKRILCSGRIIGPVFHNKSAIRLIYDDWESLPYLNGYDFLRFENIEHIKSKWKFGHRAILIDYRTKYVEEKGKTIFGPFFFKFELPKSAEVKDGIVKIEINIEPHQYKHFPKDFRKMRQERIVETVKNYQSVLS